MNIINIELTIKCIYYLNILFILYNSGICHSFSPIFKSQIVQPSKYLNISVLIF